MLDYWKTYPPPPDSLEMLLGAYTTWEPRFRGADSNEAPIPGVDYAEGARSFDMLPLSVQQFFQESQQKQTVQ